MPAASEGDPSNKNKCEAPIITTNGGRSREQTAVRGWQSKIVGFGERCVKTRFRTQSLHKHKDLQSKPHPNKDKSAEAPQAEPTPNREQRADLFALCRGAKEEEQI